jgi:hypothetical protein
MQQHIRAAEPAERTCELSGVAVEDAHGIPTVLDVRPIV